MNATSSQDEFAKWAKLRRQHDKAVGDYEEKCMLFAIPFLAGGMRVYYVHVVTQHDRHFARCKEWASCHKGCWLNDRAHH
jgi:hypothetical protein